MKPNQHTENVAVPQNDTPRTEANTADEARQNNGRFAKGNRCGHGNPFARQTARLRQAMLDAVSPEDMAAIIDSMKKKAIDGDVPAAKLIMSYCIGKPAKAEDPDTLNLHELKTIMSNHLDAADGPLNVIKGMPLEVVIDMLRLILPILRSEKVKLAKDVLCAPLTEDEIEDNKVDIEDNKVDDDEDDSPNNAQEPAGDPLDNVPQWMRDIGKETEASAPKTKRKKAARAKPAATEEAHRPAGPMVDEELLCGLLERARSLKAANPPGEELSEEQAMDLLAELSRLKNGQHSPSTNGADGKK